MVRTLIVLTVLLTVSERALADGNVQAKFQFGTLFLVGDNLGNDVSVEFPNGGGFVVTGNAGTTINGQAAFANANADVKKFKAEMNGGDDTLTVSSTGGAQTSLDGWAWVNLASGSDFVEFTDIAFQMGIEVYGDTGEDLIILENADAGNGFGDGILIKGGDHNDTVAVFEADTGSSIDIFGQGGHDDLSVSESFVGAFIEIDGGGGDDFIEVESTTNERTTRLYGDSGKDEIRLTSSDIEGNVLIVSGNETDLVSVEDILVGLDFHWEGRSGDDGFVMTGSDIFGQLRLDGGGDDDLIGLSGVFVNGETRIRGAAGDDLVVLSDTPSGSNTFQRTFHVEAGFGDDGVHICGVHDFFQDLLLDGGPNFDRLWIEEEQNVGGRLVIRNFESEDDTSLEQRRLDMIAALADCFPGIAETAFPLLCAGVNGMEGEM